MDTTPDTESTERHNAPSSPEAAVEELAAMDAADAPDLAERLAADLAGELEDTGTAGEPAQLAAPFPDDEKEGS
jgi:hypothetical protein